MRIYPFGVVVLVAFLALFALALSDPTWTRIAEAIVTVLIALGIARFLPSRMRKSRSL